MFMLKQESFWERCRRKTSSSWSSRETSVFFFGTKHLMIIHPFPHLTSTVLRYPGRHRELSPLLLIVSICSTHVFTPNSCVAEPPNPATSLTLQLQTRQRRQHTLVIAGPRHPFTHMSRKCTDTGWPHELAWKRKRHKVRFGRLVMDSIDSWWDSFSRVSVGNGQQKIFRVLPQ
jgi:hypothetical protein